MTEQVALAGRIRESLVELDRVVERAILLRGKAVSTSEDGFWDAVALNLQSFYTGLERIFEDIARTMDGSVPSGAEWHRNLLLQMTSEVSGRRPAVISRDTRSALDEYCSFRHVIRKLYAFNLRPARLEELVASLKSCYQAVRRELGSFTDFLNRVDEEGPRK